MADNPLPPIVPQLTLPVPQRNDPANFRQRADTLLTELPLVVDGINAASVYIQGAKMDVASMEGIRDETYAARDATQVIRDVTDQIRLSAITQLDALADDKISTMDGIRDATDQIRLGAITQLGTLADDKIVAMDGIREATDQVRLGALAQLGSLADDKTAVMDGIRDSANQAATAAAAYAEAAGQAAGLPEFLEGTEGKPMTRMRDGSGVHFSQEFTPYLTVTKSTQLVAGERYRADTSAGTFNLLLPASPFTGATVWIFDAKGTWRVNPPILKRSGRLIMGLDEDMELNVNNAATGFVFDGADWRNIA